MITTLIYASESSLPEKSVKFKNEIARIGDVAKIRNHELGVTGFLFYFDSRFVQILEGHFDSVTKVYSSIRRDRRHANVRMISVAEVEKRAFETWAMGCSIGYILKHRSEMRITMRFIERFISGANQPPIMLRDLLASIAGEMQKMPRFPPARFAA